jgi:hypothetical protein
LPRALWPVSLSNPENLAKVSSPLLIWFYKYSSLWISHELKSK